MPAIGAPRRFEDKFLFRVEIDGITHAGFQKCSELSAEIDVINYREGGALAADKSPGLINFTDLTLERGAVASDSELYDWFERVVDYAKDKGDIEDTFRKNLDIVILDRDKRVIKRWRLDDAWPSKFTAGEWDNDSSEKTIEMVTIVFRGFKRIKV